MYRTSPMTHEAVFFPRCNGEIGIKYKSKILNIITLIFRIKRTDSEGKASYCDYDTDIEGNVISCTYDPESGYKIDIDGNNTDTIEVEPYSALLSLSETPVTDDEIPEMEVKNVSFEEAVEILKCRPDAFNHKNDDEMPSENYIHCTIFAATA